MSQVPNIRDFVAYVQTLKGDEKGEAQVFCDKLFRAFGHAGYKEAGATLEERVRAKGQKTKFADLVWRPRLLIEMKSRGEKLQRHYGQAFEYWLQLVPQRPKFVILCNFDEFWIYDFDAQLNEPVDVVPIQDLPHRYTALNFLFPDERRPQFGNDRVAVTRAAADKVASVFKALIARGEGRSQAQRFVLQCVVAMFAEDAELLPRGLFSEILADCRNGTSSYDLVGSLFRQMNNPQAARGGRFKQVRYFNGGIFSVVDPIELDGEELARLADASSEDWSKVQPPIFGTLFQGSMDKEERHALGAHFTTEADIQKVVLPTITRPWRERIASTSTLKDLRSLRDELLGFQVLDPACGSGNFLYVAYRELKRLELELLSKIHANFGSRARDIVGSRTLVSTRQLHGIEKDPFGVELAKVTLMLAKELALDERRAWLDTEQQDLPIEFDSALPLDNLDANIRCDDALFCQWPKVSAIVGNPPYQSKNKAQQELGAAYLRRIRSRYPEIPGHADYCVYWFRRAHDELGPGNRAGLVGTKTIRETNSRKGGLDYIVTHGGTITEAISRQVWSGEAAVDVSIVNWVKGKQHGKKKLFLQIGNRTDSPWVVEEVDHIHAGLSFELDVSTAQDLRVNLEPKTTHQGVTPGHRGFLLKPDVAAELIRREPRDAEVIFPYLIGEDLLERKPSGPSRYIIDLHPRDLLAASRHPAPLAIVQAQVLEARQEALANEGVRNREVLDDDPEEGVNRHHENFLNKWWLPSYPRADLIRILQRLPRCIVCVRTTMRPIFEFVHPSIRPGDALQVFTFADDYSFGILQAPVHWKWFTERCSKLSARFRYTSETVFSTFPWPQNPTLLQVKKIAAAAVGLRGLRARVMAENDWSLRDLYRTVELPGQNPLKAAIDELDSAVRAAYGMRANADVLAFLLDLNLKLAEREASLQPVVGPGLPPVVTDPTPFITTDCVRMP